MGSAMRYCVSSSIVGAPLANDDDNDDEDDEFDEFDDDKFADDREDGDDEDDEGRGCCACIRRAMRERPKCARSAAREKVVAGSCMGSPTSSSRPFLSSLSSRSMRRGASGCALHKHGAHVKVPRKAPTPQTLSQEVLCVPR